MTMIIVTSAASVILMFLAVAFTGIWVYKDAKQRGLNAGLWTLLVVLSGNFIGLILYLLIGRKQMMISCDACGAKINVQGGFCQICGEKTAAKSKVVSSRYGLLAASIICIVLAFIFLGLLIFFSFSGNGGGFAVNSQYSYYSYGTGGYAKKLMQKSSGDTWSLSFEETSDGYVISKTYNAKSEPLRFNAQTDGDGSVQLMIMQNGISINETLSAGDYSFDLSGFETGKISIKIINIDASVYSCEISMVTASDK